VQELYKILLAGRQDDAQRFWVIFAVLNVINGGLFAAVVSQSSMGGVRIVAAIFGIVLCFVWASTQSRMTGWIEWWEEKLKEIEPGYIAELRTAATTPEATRVLSGIQIFINRKPRTSRWAISTRRIGWFVPLIFGAAWIATLLLLYSAPGKSIDDIRL